MSDKLYNLSLHEAIDVLIDGGNIVGNDFIKGHYLKLNKVGQLTIVNADRFYRESTDISFKSLSKQKFREVSVMTLKELSKQEFDNDDIEEAMGYTKFNSGNLGEFKKSKH